MQHAATTQEGLSLWKWNHSTVDVHLGIAAKCGEVLVRIQMTVRTHCLSRLEVNDAVQTGIDTAERAVASVPQVRAHIFAETGRYP